MSAGAGIRVQLSRQTHNTEVSWEVAIIEARAIVRDTS
jgi:hypothetical protein